MFFLFSNYCENLLFVLFGTGMKKREKTKGKKKVSEDENTAKGDGKHSKYYTVGQNPVYTVYH